MRILYRPILAIVAAGTLCATAEARPGHGPLSIEEIEARHAQLIERSDQDGDGALSLDEFQMMPPPHERGRHSRRGRHQRHGRPGGRLRAHMPELFATLDTDGDGQVSSQEFEKLAEAGDRVRRQAAFAHFDSNGDGLITTDDEPPHLRHLRELDVDGNGIVTREELRTARRERRDQRNEDRENGI